MDRPIVTMTTIPPRFGLLAPAFESLLAQTLPPERILLFVPSRYRRFQNWDRGGLPRLPRRVQPIALPRDYGPATKVLAAIRTVPDPDRAIVFCDDDICYPPDFIERLVQGAAARPDMAITLDGLDAPGKSNQSAPTPRARQRSARADWRYQTQKALFRVTRADRFARAARRPFRGDGLVDLFGHGAGGLIRPRFFDGGAFAIPNLLWGLDTIWLSGQLAARGVPIWLAANGQTVTETEAATQAPLWGHQGANDVRAAETQAIAYMRRNLGVWR